MHLQPHRTHQGCHLFPLFHSRGGISGQNPGDGWATALWPYQSPFLCSVCTRGAGCPLPCTQGKNHWCYRPRRHPQATERSTREAARRPCSCFLVSRSSQWWSGRLGGCLLGSGRLVSLESLRAAETSASAPLGHWGCLTDILPHCLTPTGGFMRASRDTRRRTCSWARKSVSSSSVPVRAPQGTSPSLSGISPPPSQPTSRCPDPAQPAEATGQPHRVIQQPSGAWWQAGDTFSFPARNLGTQHLPTCQPSCLQGAEL